MDFSTNQQMEYGDDGSSVGMGSIVRNNESAQQDAIQKDVPNGDAADDEDEEDAITKEAKEAVTKDREHLRRENTARLQTILESIKNSTKNILKEMDQYLAETEEVEKTFIECRAATQRESRRMEMVEPDVTAATQRECTMC